MQPTSKFSDPNSCRSFSALKETLRFEKLLLDAVWAVKDLPPPAKTSPLLVFNAGVGIAHESRVNREQDTDWKKDPDWEAASVQSSGAAHPA